MSHQRLSAQRSGSARPRCIRTMTETTSLLRTVCDRARSLGPELPIFEGQAGEFVAATRKRTTARSAEKPTNTLHQEKTLITHRQYSPRGNVDSSTESGALHPTSPSRQAPIAGLHAKARRCVKPNPEANCWKWRTLEGIVLAHNPIPWHSAGGWRRRCDLQSILLSAHSRNGLDIHLGCDWDES